MAHTWQFSDKLVDFRKSRDLTIQGISDKLGISTNTYWRYEHGSTPSAEVLFKLRDLGFDCLPSDNSDSLAVKRMVNYFIENTEKMRELALAIKAQQDKRPVSDTANTQGGLDDVNLPQLQFPLPVNESYANSESINGNQGEDTMSRHQEIEDLRVELARTQSEVKVLREMIGDYKEREKEAKEVQDRCHSLMNKTMDYLLEAREDKAPARPPGARVGK